VVLLHGWGLNGAAWRPVAERLSGTMRLHVVDLPGFGHSPLPPGGEYSLEAIAEALRPHIPPGAALIGWSLGGLVALQLANQLSPPPAGLMLVASNPMFMAAEDWPGIQPRVLDSFQQALQQDIGKTIERFLAIQALGAPNAKQDIKRLKGWIHQRPAPHPDALSGGLEILRQADLRPQLDGLRVPLAGVFGRLDSLVPRSLHAELSERVPEGRFQLLADAAHAPFVSHADWFVEEVNLWLEQLGT